MPKTVKIVKESDKDDEAAIPSVESHYPYGTSITLRDRLVTELGLSKLSAGDVLMIRATVVVDRVSESKSDTVDEGGEVENTVTLQLTSLSTVDDEGPTAKVLYGD